MTEPKIIALPAEAIKLWKEPDSSIKNTTITNDLLWKIFAKGALTAIMISGLLIMCAPAFTHEPMTSNLAQFISMVGALMAIVDMSVTFFMITRWYGRGRTYSTRSMILFGCGYNNIDPDDCCLREDHDLCARPYVIVPTKPPEKG